MCSVDVGRACSPESKSWYLLKLSHDSPRPVHPRRPQVRGEIGPHLNLSMFGGRSRATELASVKTVSHVLGQMVNKQVRLVGFEGDDEKNGLYGMTRSFADGHFTVHLDDGESIQVKAEHLDFSGMQEVKPIAAKKPDARQERETAPLASKDVESGKCIWTGIVVEQQKKIRESGFAQWYCSAACDKRAAGLHPGNWYSCLQPMFMTTCATLRATQGEKSDDEDDGLATCAARLLAQLIVLTFFLTLGSLFLGYVSIFFLLWFLGWLLSIGCLCQAGCSECSGSDNFFRTDEERDIALTSMQDIERNQAAEYAKTRAEEDARLAARDERMRDARLKQAEAEISEAQRAKRRAAAEVKIAERKAAVQVAAAVQQRDGVVAAAKRKIKEVRADFQVPTSWQKMEVGETGVALCSMPRDTHTAIWISLERLFQNVDRSDLGVGRDVVKESSPKWYNVGAHVQTKEPRLKLVAVWHVENPSLWRKYMAAKEEVSKQLNRLESAPGGQFSREYLKTDINSPHWQVDPPIDQNVNEQLLLHGTKPETLMTVLANGPSEKFSDGLFGEGTYFAETPAKNDQYTTPDRGSQTDPKIRELHKHLYHDKRPPHVDVQYILVCRVLMGACIETAAKGKGKGKNVQMIRKKPAPTRGNVWAKDNKELAQVIEHMEPPVHFHGMAVHTSPDGLQRHREFLQYHQDRIYPEYLLAYHRTVQGRPV